MMLILALVPFILLTLVQLLALAALRSGLQQQDLFPVAPLWPAVTAYIAGAALCCAALVLALALAALALAARAKAPGAAADSGVALALVLGVAAGALVVLGPLLWGHATGEFTISHHMVRALLVAPTIVLYCWYVTADR